MSSTVARAVQPQVPHCESSVTKCIKKNTDVHAEGFQLRLSVSEIQNAGTEY